jgi:8-oxo-dGTP pyrophosphatase MutT (NUDIX family)
MENRESIVSDQEGFKSLVTARLQGQSSEFLQKHRYIQDRERHGERYQTSGVILLLLFSEERGQYEFVLTKRSHYVVQPGDLCCPGGHVSPHDKIHGFLIARGISPLINSHNLLKSIGARGDGEIKIIADYLSTALREAKEETGLPSKSVEYLGPLPPYGLISFNRVIFPLVGLVSGKWKRRLNWEVEKIITIGLKEMLHPENYFWLTFNKPEDIESSRLNGRDFPSFVSDDGGIREILWGATFNIIQSFLRIVLNFTLPRIPPGRVVYKEIPESYFTGNFHRLTRKGFKRDGRR